MNTMDQLTATSANSSARSSSSMKSSGRICCCCLPSCGFWAQSFREDTNVEGVQPSFDPTELKYLMRELAFADDIDLVMHCELTLH